MRSDLTWIAEQRVLLALRLRELLPEQEPLRTLM